MIDTSHAGPARLRPKPKLTFVLGGARSGKSAYAERLALELAGVDAPLYIATAEPLDGEMEERIRRHRERRGARWLIVEEPVDLAAAIDRHAGAGRPILIDCLTLWLSNLMGAGRDIAAAATALQAAIGRATSPVILISNEVGQGIVPENALARAFRDEAGLLNQRLAAQADKVVLLVAGLPLTLKEAGVTAERAP